MKNQDKTKEQLINELVELRRRIAELEASETKLRQAEDELSVAYDALYSTVGGVIITDLEGKIRYVNPAFLRMFEYEDRDEVVGKCAAELFPSERVQKFSDVQAVIDQVKGETEEFLACRKDGTIFPVEVSSSMVTDKEGNSVGRMASFVDITKRKRAEEGVEHLGAVLRAIRSVNQLIIRERDRDRLLQGACDRLIETCGYDNAWIALMDETGVLVTATGAGSDKEFLPILERLKRGELPDCAQQALSQSEVVVTDGLSFLHADRPLVVNYGGGGVMTVRLEYREKVYGLLSVFVSADFATIEEEHALFREVAGDIAFALYSIELEEKRKRAEEARRESEERFRDLYESAPNAYLSVGADGLIHRCNRRAGELLGYAVEELVGRPVKDLYVDAPQGKEKAAKIFERFRGGETVRDEELQMQRADGTPMWISLTVNAVRDVQGRVVESRSMVVDVTERKRAEEALQDSEARYRLLVEMSPYAIGVHQDGKLVFANPAAARLLGADAPHELVGKPITEIVHPEGWEAAHDRIQRMLAGETGLYPSEDLYVRLDGSAVPVEVTVAPFTYRGRPAIQVIALDITKRKRGEEELRWLKEFNEDIVLSMAEGIAVEDTEGCFTFVNPAAAAMLGYAPRELLGQHWMAIIPPDQQSIVEAADERRARGEVDRYEVELVRKDGRRLSALVSGSPRFEEGRFAGTLAVFTDITKRKRSERLLQALNEAALAMERALTPEEIFTAVAEELKKLGFSCGVFLTDESQSRLFPKYLTYDAAAIKAAERLVGLKLQDFSIPIEKVDAYRKVVREKKTVFVENAEELVRQVLPKPLKRFARQIVRIMKVPKALDVPLVVEDEVIGVLAVQSDDLTEDDIPAITAFAHQMAAAWRKARLMQDLKTSLAEVQQAQEELQRTAENLRKTLGSTIQAMAFTVETRDPYTAGHQRQVANLARAIGTEMGLSKEQVEGIRMAAVIHDMGKITVPTDILNKPGRLNEHEFGIIKAHPEVAYNILKTIEFPWPIAQIIFQHHERMDGSGYPQGLSGEEIIVEARVLAVADVVEAMASHRPYRPARGIDKALEEISQNKGVLSRSNRR